MMLLMGSEKSSYETEYTTWSQLRPNHARRNSGRTHLKRDSVSVSGRGVLDD